MIINTLRYSPRSYCLPNCDFFTFFPASAPLIGGTKIPIHYIYEAEKPLNLAIFYLLYY